MGHPRILKLAVFALLLNISSNALAQTDRELIESWLNFAEALKSVPAYKSSSRTSSDAGRAHGIAEEVATYYVALPDYSCNVIEYIPNESPPTDFVNYRIFIRTPMNSIGLYRNHDNERWKIAGSQDTSHPISDGFNVLRLIPRPNANPADMDGFISNLKIERRELEQSLLELDCTLIKPVVENYFGGEVTTKRLIITFKRPFLESGVHLPTRIHRLVDTGTEDLWWSVKCDDFVRVGDAWVPKVIQQSAVENLDDVNDFYETITYDTIVPVERTDVVKRCGLEYWQLANINMGKSNLQWWVIGGLACFSLAAWWWRSSRTT